MHDIDHQLKILQVNTSDRGGGGAERIGWHLFCSFQQRGIDSWLAVGHKVSDNPNVLVIPNEEKRSLWTRTWRQWRSRISASKKLHSCEDLVGKIAWLGDPCRIKDYVLGIEDFNYKGTSCLLELTNQKPTLVHCHNLHSGYFDLRILPWLSHQVPVILNLHDAWLLSGHCAHSFDCERWKMGCGHCPYLTIYPGLRRDTTAYNWRRKSEIFAKSRLYVTAPSKWLIDRVQQSMLRAVEYRVVPNGIDLDTFRPGDPQLARTKLGLPLNSRIILYAANGGSKSTWRDFGALVTVMRQVAVACRNELLLLCLGEQTERKDMIFDRLRIHFRYFERDPKKMALYYQSADVYALPAKAETFGLTVTEAMACGVPIVATNVGGIPEQVKDGETGFLVPLADIGGMAPAIRRLLSDDKMRQRMGTAAAEYAKRFFGLERQVDSLLDWYIEVRRDWLEWRKYEESHVN